MSKKNKAIEGHSKGKYTTPEEEKKLAAMVARWDDIQRRQTDAKEFSEWKILLKEKKGIDLRSLTELCGTSYSTLDRIKKGESTPTEEIKLRAIEVGKITGIPLRFSTEESTEELSQEEVLLDSLKKVREGLEPHQKKDWEKLFMAATIFFKRW